MEMYKDTFIFLIIIIFVVGLLLGYIGGTIVCMRDRRLYFERRITPYASGRKKRRVSYGYRDNERSD